MHSTAVSHATPSRKRGLLQVAHFVKLPGSLHRGKLVEVRLVLAAVSARLIASVCHNAGATSAASAVLRLEAGVRTGRAAPAPLSGGPGAPQARPSSGSPPCRRTRAAAALDARYAPGRQPQVANARAVPLPTRRAHRRDSRAQFHAPGPVAGATLKRQPAALRSVGRRSHALRGPRGLAQ